MSARDLYYRYNAGFLQAGSVSGAATCRKVGVLTRFGCVVGLDAWHPLCDASDAMSPVARALEKRFGEMCRTEIARMTRKTRGLSPDERLALQDLSLQVVNAIATRAGAALEQPGGEHLGSVVVRLFDVKEVP
jgi:hypothetical protein